MSVIRLYCDACKEELMTVSVIRQPGITLKDITESFSLGVPVCSVCSKRMIDTAYDEGRDEALRQ
jgi:hypothetical protein